MALDASLARLEVMLEASLARLDVTPPALSVAEAKADDRTPRAPEEMAVADALADWAMAGKGQRRPMDGRQKINLHSQYAVPYEMTWAASSALPHAS